MKNYNDDFIKDAFTKIRADFEKRNNEQGLEILDSNEDQWNATGNLSDRQIAWVERQLDGSWCRTEKQSTNGERSDFINGKEDDYFAQIPPTARGVEQLLDAMIRERLSEQGKTLVDLARLNELEQVVEDLRQLVKSLT